MFSIIRHCCCCYLITLSRVPFFWDPMDCSPSGSSVHGILQARCWSGLPFPSPGDLPDSGIKPRSPALAVVFLTTEAPGEPSQAFSSVQFSPSGMSDWAELYSFPDSEPVCCSMSSSNCCLLTCIQISQEVSDFSGQVVWYSQLFVRH